MLTLEQLEVAKSGGEGPKLALFSALCDFIEPLLQQSRCSDTRLEKQCVKHEGHTGLHYCSGMKWTTGKELDLTFCSECYQLLRDCGGDCGKQAAEGGAGRQ